MLSVGSDVVIVAAGSTTEHRHISETVPSPNRTYQHTSEFVITQMSIAHQTELYQE